MAVCVLCVLFVRLYILFQNIREDLLYAADIICAFNYIHLARVRFTRSSVGQHRHGRRRRCCYQHQHSFKWWHGEYCQLCVNYICSGFDILQWCVNNEGHTENSGHASLRRVYETDTPITPPSNCAN